IEIGAEVYAAELIFPEPDFLAAAASLRINRGDVDAPAVIKLKHETRTTLSYAALVKRFEFFEFVAPKTFAKVRWKKLEETIYGDLPKSRSVRQVFDGSTYGHPRLSRDVPGRS